MYLQESLELQIMLFIVMFLDGSYYVALSQTITTVTKSIQFGLYMKVPAFATGLWIGWLCAEIGI